MVFPPGTYEHECPACGRTVVFVVSPVYCGTGGVKRPTCGGDDDDDKSWTVKQRSYKASLSGHLSDDITSRHALGRSSGLVWTGIDAVSPRW
jgi:hypothetical protein